MEKLVHIGDDNLHDCAIIKETLLDTAGVE